PLCMKHNVYQQKKPQNGAFIYRKYNANDHSYAISPCSAISRPIDSLSLLALTPISMSTILNKIHVITALKTIVAAVATTCIQSWFQSPYSAPCAPPSPVIVCVAKTPIRIDPIIPPTPCTPKASNESS